MGTFIGMESVRKVPIADKSLLPRIETDSPNGDSSTSGGGVGSFQFPTEFSIHLRFKQFPTWLLQISLAEKREQPHQNRGGISSASSSPSMANKPLAVPPDAFVFAHSTSGSAVVSATFAAMDTPKSFVVFKIWLNEIVTAPSGGGNAGGAFLAKSIPISPADLHSVSSSSPSSSSVSSKFNSKIWSTFDFVDLSKAVEIARYVAIIIQINIHHIFISTRLSPPRLYQIQYLSQSLSLFLENILSWLESWTNSVFST